MTQGKEKQNVLSAEIMKQFVNTAHGEEQYVQGAVDAVSFIVRNGERVTQIIQTATIEALLQEIFKKQRGIN